VAESVSVATYNLYLGADLSIVLGERPQDELVANHAEVKRQLLATAFPARAQHVARTIAERGIDLVGLQEVCCWSISEQQVWDFTEILLDALRECGEDYEVVSEVATFSGDGVLPPEEPAGATLPVALKGSNVVLRRAASTVRVTEEGHGLFEAALGVPSFNEQWVAIARGWCGVRCEIGGVAFAFVNTHTEAFDRGSRNRQRDELMAACDRWRDDPMLLVGDFNAPPDTVGLPSGMVDAWSVNDGDPGYTCCQSGDLRNEESLLHERIDYVWVRDARVRSAELLGADRSLRQSAGMWPSDHAGVHAVVELG
jgi:hypothetical protein